MPDGCIPVVTPPILPPITPKVRQPPEPPPNPVRYVEPRWLSDGMIAYVRWNREKGTLLKVRVVCAAGMHGHVVNENFEYDRWKHIDDLLVPDTAPQARILEMSKIPTILDGGC